MNIKRSLKAIVLGASIISGSCGPKPICYPTGESICCHEVDDDFITTYHRDVHLIVTYPRNVEIITSNEYCELRVSSKSQKHRWYYIDRECDGTVDEYIHEEATNGAFHSERRQRPVLSSYDSFFKKKRDELLEGEK